MNVIKSIIAELKSTSWPTPRQLMNLVLYTIIICGIITILILGLDAFLLRIREIIL